MQAVSHHQLSLPHVHWCKFASSWHLVRNNNSISQLGHISERWKKWWIKEQFIRISQKCNLWECNVSAGVLTHFCFPEAKQYSKTERAMSFQPQKKNRTAKQLHLCMQMLDQVHPQCWLTFKAVGITNSVINHALRCSATDPQGSTWPCSSLLSRTWHTKACCAGGTGPKHCSGTGYIVRSPVFYSHQSQ